MKYGIVENNKFSLIDSDIERLRNTIAFMPNLSLSQIKEYQDNEIEMSFDGNWYLKGHAPKQPIDEAKLAKLSEINQKCDDILKEAVKTYPETEVMTFSQQVSEAKQYQQDNTSPVFLLSGLATNRGIELSVLVEKILEKHNTYSLLSGKTIGLRQRLEDRLNNCKSTDEVNEINVKQEFENV